MTGVITACGGANVTQSPTVFLSPPRIRSMSVTALNLGLEPGQRNLIKSLNFHQKSRAQERPMFRFRTFVPLAIVVFCILPALSQSQQNDGVYDCGTGQPETVPAVQPPSSTFTAQDVANLLAGEQIHCDVDGLI